MAPRVNSGGVSRHCCNQSHLQYVALIMQKTFWCIKSVTLKSSDLLDNLQKCSLTYISYMQYNLRVTMGFFVCLFKYSGII